MHLSKEQIKIIKRCAHDKTLSYAYKKTIFEQNTAELLLSKNKHKMFRFKSNFNIQILNF